MTMLRKPTILTLYIYKCSINDKHPSFYVYPYVLSSAHERCTYRMACVCVPKACFSLFSISLPQLRWDLCLSCTIFQRYTISRLVFVFFCCFPGAFFSGRSTTKKKISRASSVKSCACTRKIYIYRY